MRKFTLKMVSALMAFMLVAGIAYSQMPEAISIDPPDATAFDELTLTIDANESCPDGDLLGVSQVFIHSGVTINGEQWQNVIDFDGQGQNGQSPELTDNGDGTWSITYVPADYYGIEEGAEVTEICAVFNDGTWDHEGKDFDDQGNCMDFYIPLNTGGGNQTPIYEDDFESYNVGDMIAEVSGAWTTWSDDPGGPEDAPITDEQANSGSKSVKIAEGSSSDLILPLGDKITGTYSVSMYMYVEDGYGAYYNLLHDFAGGDSEWAMEAYFASDGSGYIHAGGANAATFNYPTGQWFMVETMVNIDEDTAVYYVDGTMVHGWQWSLTSQGDPGLNQLGAMDIFAAAPSGDDYKFYFDDLSYVEMAPPPLYADDFESYNVGDMLAEVSDAWTTWSDDPGGPEDAPITDEQANSGSKSVKVAEGSSTDLILPLGDKITGRFSVSMYMYVDEGYGAYYNLLHDFAGGDSEWALESFFASDGTGYINAGGSNAATFEYPTGTWFMVKTEIDLDADNAKYYVDGTMVHEWQWSLTATGDPGINQLGAMDVFAHAPGGDSPNFYFDDILYEEMAPPPLYEDDFESYSVGDMLAEVSDAWTTWSEEPGGPEDAPIVDEQANSGSQSVKVAEGSSTDLVLPLGDKITGEYSVSMYIYVDKNHGAYYNLLHDFAGGDSEWAMEAFFASDGTGYINAGGSNAATFEYPNQEWFKVETVINIDEDTATYYVNETMVHGWQWSLTATGDPGMNQLGAVDIFAHAPGGDTPNFYFDDVMYVELGGGGGPADFELSETSLLATIEQNTTTTKNFDITSTGAQDLEWSIVVTYPPEDKLDPIEPTHTPHIVNNSVPAADPNGKPASDNPSQTEDEEVLNYDGPNDNAIGLTEGGQWRVAAMFPVDMIQPFIGMELTSVEVYIGDMATAYNLQVYDMGVPTVPGAGELIYEQEFSPVND
ncbi:MAG: LamG domain-containing protein, partial [Bacteroidales bacterium]|nr:LamG domain-containing protein [Bacteroidales bacterium]